MSIRKPVGADTVAGVGAEPPLPIVTGYPGEAAPVESITNKYAALPGLNAPFRTVAVIEALLHAVGVITAKFVQFV